MAWISYRKVIDEPERLDLDWLDVTLPKLRNNKRWPFIIAADGTPCHYANLFLLDEPIFKGCTEATLKTYAESLVSFLICLEQSTIKWKDVNKYDILMYRESMRIPDCGQPTLSSQTINLRLTVIESFYQWAALRFPNIFLHNEIESKSKETIEQNPYNLNLKKRSLIPRLKTFSGYSEIPTSVDALDFIGTLSEPYDLMAKWQLLTGLRASGVRNLSLSNISTAKPCNQSAYKLLIKEKPSKPRFIYPPRFLIDETKLYIKGVRKSDRRKTLTLPINREGKEVLFINSRGSQISKTSYCNIFKKTSKENAFNIKSHMLRSAFATNMLAILRRLETEGLSINSLLVVRDLLGHSWISTTEKYLKNVDVEIAIDSMYKNTKDVYFLDLAEFWQQR